MAAQTHATGSVPGPRLQRRTAPLAWGALCIALLALAGCATPSWVPFVGATANASSVTAPAQILRGPDGATLVVVQLTISGKGPYAFALDTGASLTLIDSDLAQQLRLPVAGPPESIAGVGGKQRVIPVNVKVWALGAATLPSRTITSASLAELRRDDGIVGLLGSDVLSAFSSVTVDYANSQVILTFPAPSS